VGRGGNDNTNPIHDNLAPHRPWRAKAARAVCVFSTRREPGRFQFLSLPRPQEVSTTQASIKNQYCAWHDYTTPAGYPGVQQGIAFYQHALRPWMRAAAAEWTS